MSKENRYTVAVLNAQHIIQGQLELYKIEFSETGDNKYLQVMNDLHQTQETIRRMDKVINRVLRENQKLRQSLKDSSI